MKENLQKLREEEKMPAEKPGKRDWQREEGDNAYIWNEDPGIEDRGAYRGGPPDLGGQAPDRDCYSGHPGEDHPRAHGHAALLYL